VLTIVPHTHAVIESSLRQLRFCIFENFLSHLGVRRLHAVQFEFGMLVLVDIFERL
jgi:hypothetical protein